MTVERPPAPPSSSRQPLLTLRTALILTIGLLVAAGMGAATVVANLAAWETAATAGAAFASVVTFLHEIIE